MERRDGTFIIDRRAQWDVGRVLAQEKRHMQALLQLLLGDPELTQLAA